jgi:hypothetical protein
MGNAVKNKIRGMGLTAKVGLVVTLTMLMSTFMYQGWYKPMMASASIGTTTAWTALTSTYHTATKTPTANIAVAGTASTNRVLAVAVSYIGTAAGTATCAVTYGGTALTQAAGDAAATSSLDHTWIFYLPENNTLMDGTTKGLATTITTTTTALMTEAYYTVLNGVDQTTPLGAGTRPAVNRTAIAGTAVTMTAGSGLVGATNEQSLSIIGSARSGSTTAVTVTTPTGWTNVASQNSTTTNSNRSYVHTKASSATEDLLAATASSSNCVTSETAVSFRPSVSAITTTLASGTMGTSANATVSQSDTNKPVGSFTLSASGGADTVTGLIVNGGSNLTTANVSAVKIWADTNGNGVLDAGEITTPVASQTTIASNTATFTGLALAVASGTTNSYIITYDIGTSPTNANTLTAYVSSFTPGGNSAGSDAVDSTLTISNVKTNAGTATASAYGATFIAVAMPYTNDVNADNSYTLDYAPYTSGACSAIASWTNFVTNAAHVATPANIAITGLTPATQYCVRATYNDAAGVVGTTPQYLGPVTTRAAGAWTVLNDTNPNAATLTGGTGGNGRSAFAYTVPAGSNRLVLVAVQITNGSSVTAAANSYAVSLGGVALTKISGTDDGVTTNRAGLYLGYLKESSIPAGANYVDFATTAASAFTSYKVMVSTYSSIDQASPLSGTPSLSYSSTAAVVSTGISVPGAGTYSAGDIPLFVMASSVAEASLTSIASTPAGVYTDLSNAILGSGNAGMLAVSGRATPAATGQDTGVAVTWPTSGRPAVIGAVLRAYVLNTNAGTATAVVDGHQGINVSAPYSGDGNGDNKVKVEWQYSGGDWSNPVGSYGPAHIGSYNIPGLTVGGFYDVRVTYTDGDGVTGTAVQTISNISVTEISTIVLAGSVSTPTPFTIAFSMPYNYDTNINNTYTVDYKISGAGTWTNFVTGAIHTASPFTGTLAGLLPDTNYDVQLTFVDANGISGTNPQLFTLVHTPAENKAYPGVATAIENNTSSINFSMPYDYDMNHSSTYTVDYKVTGSPDAWTNYVDQASNQVSPYTGTISGLVPGKSYDIRMTYNDPDGFALTNPVVQTATVLLPVDATTPGAMTFIAAETDMTVNVAYANDTNDDNACVISYGTDGITYGSSAPAATVDRATSVWTAKITGLSGNTQYYFRATFSDPDGVNGTNPVNGAQKTTKPWANNKMLHNSTNMSSAKWAANGGWGIPNGKYGAFDCNTCHTPNSSNIKWVKTVITATGVARTVVYKNATSAGHDNRTVKTSSYNICEVCHTATAYHRYDATTNTGGQTHNNGTICNGCHPHSTGFKVDMSNCLGCHNSAQVSSKIPGLTRAAVSVEFGLAFGHKKSGRAAVTNDDCKVCHLEGDLGHSGDGTIALRDPDAVTNSGNVAITNISGGAFAFKRFSTSYAAGSRTSTGHTSNTDIANVITQKFCLACHDSDGAVNPKARSGASATAYNPWNGVNLGATYTLASDAAVVGGVINVKKQFTSSNSSYHPVTAPLSRDLPLASRLLAPYNNMDAGRVTAGGTKTNSVVMNCFDCHNTPAPLTIRTISAHGNAAMLRGTIYTFGGVSTLCTACHAGYNASPGTSGYHGAGSAWSATGSSHNVLRNCQDCHGSAAVNATTAPARPLNAQNYHGNNALVSGGLWPTVNSRPYAFIRAWTTGAANYHRPFRASEFTTGSATCGGGGTCPSGGSGGQLGDGNLRTYTPGGSY